MARVHLAAVFLACTLTGVKGADGLAQVGGTDERVRELVRVELAALNAEIAAALERLTTEQEALDEPAAAVPLTAGAVRLVAAIEFGAGAATVPIADRERLEGAASAMLQLGTERVQVVGFADRTGSPDANSRIALQRAETVAAVLVEAGYPAETVTVESGLETGWPLPVPTAEGVVEPRNRAAHVFAIE